jgi:hypothetical protein
MEHATSQKTTYLNKNYTMEDNEGLALAIVLSIESFLIYGDVNIEEGLDKNARLGIN